MILLAPEASVISPEQFQGIGSKLSVDRDSACNDLIPFMSGLIDALVAGISLDHATGNRTSTLFVVDPI